MTMTSKVLKQVSCIMPLEKYPWKKHLPLHCIGTARGPEFQPSIILLRVKGILIKGAAQK